MMHDKPLTVRKVAIVGFGSDDRSLVPWDDPTIEIWGLNMAHGWMPRWDRLFEMHARTEIEAETDVRVRGADHLGALKAETTRPIYMLHTHADIPCSVKFPIEAFTEYFGRNIEKLATQPYATSTFAYMLGLAIMRLAPSPYPTEDAEIHIYGVPLVNGDEYAFQRECASFYAGFAAGRGIRIVFTPYAAWLEADGLYGYARGESIALLRAMLTEVEAERDKYLADIKELDVQHRDIQMRVNTKDGARQQCDLFARRLLALMRGAKL